jgi:hypothetical protein
MLERPKEVTVHMDKLYKLVDGFESTIIAGTNDNFKTERLSTLKTYLETVTTRVCIQYYTALSISTLLTL